MNKLESLSQRNNCQRKKFISYIKRNFGSSFKKKKNRNFGSGFFIFCEDRRGIDFGM